MALETKPFDIANYLINDATISAYLTEAFQTEDPQDIAGALGDVIRARGGLDAFARETGISMNDLSMAVDVNGKPPIGTIIAVLHALGLRLTTSTLTSEAMAA